MVQTQLAVKHEDERNKLHQQLQAGKKETDKLKQQIGEMSEKLRSEHNCIDAQLAFHLLLRFRAALLRFRAVGKH